jgi:SlyX protein
MDEERLIDLETRLAFQEAALQALSDALAAQQQQIDQLLQTCRWLAERGPAPDEGAAAASQAREPPPHY